MNSSIKYATSTPEAAASDISLAPDEIPPDIIVLASSIAEVIAPAFIIIGRKKIALTIVLPLNLRFNRIAMNKLKKVIRGTSTSILSIDVVSTCLNVPCALNA